MKISFVITTYNEGPDCEATRSLLLALKPAPYEVIVVDDCSSEPVANAIRNPEPVGVTQSRRIGAAHASGDVIVLVDAHMRFPDWICDEIEACVRSHSSALFCTTCRGTGKRSQVAGAGAFFARNEDMFITRRWLKRGPLDETDTIPCLLGACYIIQREHWDFLGGICPLFRGWGTGEEDLSLRAWSSGLEIRRMNHVVADHRFNRKVQGPKYGEQFEHFNKMVLAASLFPNQFDEVWYPFMKRMYSAQAVQWFDKLRHHDELEAWVERVQSTVCYSPNELYDLCGFPIPTADSQKELMSRLQAQRSLRMFGKQPIGSLIPDELLSTIASGSTRILEWGSGGSTIALRDNGHDVTSIEHIQSWAEAVGSTYRDIEGSLLKDLPYVNVTDLGQFDTVIIHGLFRYECLRHVLNSSNFKSGTRVFLLDAMHECYRSAANLAREKLDFVQMHGSMLEGHKT